MRKSRKKMKEAHYSTFDNDDKQTNELIPEEFPDGPFGSPIRKSELVEGKETEWLEGQERMSPYSYPDEERHDDLPRRYPDAHPLNDE